MNTPASDSARSKPTDIATGGSSGAACGAAAVCAPAAGSLGWAVAGEPAGGGASEVRPAVAPPGPPDGAQAASRVTATRIHATSRLCWLIMASPLPLVTSPPQRRRCCDNRLSAISRRIIDGLVRAWEAALSAPSVLLRGGRLIDPA